MPDAHLFACGCQELDEVSICSSVAPSVATTLRCDDTDSVSQAASRLMVRSVAKQYFNTSSIDMYYYMYMYNRKTCWCLLHVFKLIASVNVPMAFAFLRNAGYIMYV